MAKAVWRGTGANRTPQMNKQLRREQREKKQAAATPAMNSPRWPRYLLICCAILVLSGSALFVLRYSSNSSSDVDADLAGVSNLPSPPQVPSPKSPPIPGLSSGDWKQLMDPTKDGWETEALAQSAQRHLDAIADLISDAETIDGSAIEEFVIPEFRCSELVATKRMVLRKNSSEVELAVLAEAGKRFTGAEGFAQALRGLISSLASKSNIRCKIKIFGLRKTPGGFSTRLLVEIAGTDASGGTQELHGQWVAQWRLLEEGPPRLATLSVETFEMLESESPLFADYAASILGGNAAYHQQLLFGLNHWYTQIEDERDMSRFGKPGIAIADVNGDGLEDFFLCQEYGIPNRLFLQNPDGTATESSAAWGVDWLNSTRSALLVDLDNDGDEDLVAVLPGCLVLAMNEGRQFKPQGYYRIGDDAMAVSAVDYDQDGDLDLYVGTYLSDAGHNQLGESAVGSAAVYYDANDGGANQLFRNEGHWNFNDVTASVGLDVNNRRFTLGAAWEDYDNDGDQDLYVANDFGRNNLFQNQLAESGKPTFLDVAEGADAVDSAFGMSVTWGDFDRDGRIDVYVSNMFSAAGGRIVTQPEFQPDADDDSRAVMARFARGNTLLRNLGAKGFADVSPDAGVSIAGWAWGSKFVDVNNNGRDDLVVANGYITNDDTDDL